MFSPCNNEEVSILGYNSVLTSKSGTITSPNYPNEYSENTDCTWMIQVLSGPITLSVGSFDLESCSDGNRSSFDYLNVSFYYKMISFFIFFA